MTPNPTVKPMEALKPCPFCGGRARYFFVDFGPDSPKPRCHTVACGTCNIYYSRHGDDFEKETILTAWNRRVSVQQEAGEALSGWQSIESAPRDGTHILACGGPQDRWRFPPTVVHYFRDPEEPGWYTSVNELAPEHPYNAAFWMPLPPPPAHSQQVVSPPGSGSFSL